MVNFNGNNFLEGFLILNATYIIIKPKGCSFNKYKKNPRATYFKGQMQRNLDNFSFLEKHSQKSQLYQQEAKSTLKNKFCANYSAQDTKIRRFPRASRKRTRNGRAWSGNEIIGFVTSYLASSFSQPNNLLEITEFVSRIS